MVEGRAFVGSSTMVFTPAAQTAIGYTLPGDSDIIVTPAANLDYTQNISYSR